MCYLTNWLKFAIYLTLQGILFFKFFRYNIPSREEMKDEVGRLNNEIREKEKFLNQGNNSVREFIKDKIGYVNNNLILVKYSRKIWNV